MFYLLLLGAAVVLCLLAFQSKEEPLAFLTAESPGRTLNKDAVHQALDIKLLTDEPFIVRVKVEIENLKVRIGDKLPLKVAGFLVATVAATWAVNNYMVPVNVLLLYPVVLLVMAMVVVRGLQVYERRVFDASFPNALNLLNGAVSSGESLMHSIIYVGNSLDDAVGREFKLMGQRLRLGRPAQEVLSESCRRFPYAPFYFFVITLRANINRGGQLKDILKRLTKVMFNSQAIDKKKGAMTSEARASAKIVGAIPFCFLLFMKFSSPENFDFIFSHPDGKPILYYVLTSEAIGLGIIWWLMKRVQG
ncbi:type II secretion system F family protein [Sansalvadorimonas sp. 2012CJ34-2]|uniref:Type II secretion system F family protein n=1 Tax=Parendozoicomonas callyspongiae TaxID=2942213 RepID=A0ABT0PJ87_9GAMM|nr:type II secretion system F family protein [Sansalvadorimonas sp. 2012CJ34-2]MCL6271460.1 type II secretion system F family protein [Sansalvadorimonas sp. 2012CJ34-2]